MILQGPILGTALGTLFTLSTLVVSSHYQYNLPLVSMQGGFMGFLGALVYGSVTRQGLGPENHYAQAATAGITAATLIMAWGLLHRIKDSGASPPPNFGMVLPKSLRSVMEEKGTLWFIFGYVLIFYGIFVLSIYLVVILTQQPALFPPDLGALVLTTCLSTAAASACISANPIVRRRIGPVNILIAACVLAGAVSILPCFMPYVWLTFIAAAAYGIGLGPIIALHIKSTTVFHAELVVWHPDMLARTAIMMALGGVSAFTGLLVSAILIESLQDGAKIAFGIAAGCLVGGGLLMGPARWRRCGDLRVSI
ncbi:hypothetical protein EK21DRAFT_103599 [Setomelanomma holmii]|uniref:MFS transporter n=1 Tax=Setomelanomma holmii TaxID=210430 RepID=A0A9P4LHW5_9PLEO|nr:hypothetical protein EK21DRAFT_103599 [Setomelanomma holmii]